MSDIINTSAEYKIETVKADDADEVKRFLNETFFKNEPMNKYLQLGKCLELENWCSDYITSGCSFKAVNNKGEIVGLILNGIINKCAEIRHSLADYCEHEQFRKILLLFEFIDTDYNLFKEYPNYTKAIDIKILSVSPAYSGIGIGAKLISTTIEWMKENDFTLIQCLCSSYFSSRLCQKLGFEKVYSLAFSDYTVNGSNPILPEEPHKAIDIFIRKL